MQWWSRFVAVAALAVTPLAQVAPAIGVQPGPTASAASTAAPAFTPPPTIDATGKADVTPELKRFIASVPNGSVVRFPAGARYRIEGVLLIRDRQNLTIDGNGATLFATTKGASTAQAPLPELKHLWPRHRVHVLVKGGSGMTIRNLEIRGANPYDGLDDRAWVPGFEAQHGIELAGVAGATIEDCKISHTFGDLISVTEGSHHVVIQRCTLADAGRQAVTVDRGTDVLITGNWMGRIRRSVIDLEPPVAWAEVKRIKVINNEIGVAKHVFVAGMGRGSHVEDILIQGNVLRGEPLEIVLDSWDGARRKDVRILDNESDVNFSGLVPPIRTVDVDGVVVEGNRQPFNEFRPMAAVDVTGSCDWTVEGNEFPGSSADVGGAVRDC